MTILIYALIYTPYKGGNWSVTNLKYDKYLLILFNCNCLFRPLARQKGPFITAHFKSSLHNCVHHCMLKQVLLITIYRPYGSDLWLSFSSAAWTVSLLKLD